MCMLLPLLTDNRQTAATGAAVALRYDQRDDCNHVKQIQLPHLESFITGQ